MSTTAPAVPAGLVAVTVVSLTTVNAVAAVVPKLTAVAPVKPVPVIVTMGPPAADPPVGLMLVPIGVGATAKAAVLVPRTAAVAARTAIDAPAASRLRRVTRVDPCLVPMLRTTSLRLDRSRTGPHRGARVQPDPSSADYGQSPTNPAS